MINLDYYFRTDIYELNNIINKGLSFDYLKTAREYGFALYLTDKTSINLNNKNVILDVHFKNVDNILVVTNFEELKTTWLIPNTNADISSYINNNGKNERLGTKFVEPILATTLGYNGVRITSENLLVLYNTSNIKNIKVNEKQ